MKVKILYNDIRTKIADYGLASIILPDGTDMRYGISDTIREYSEKLEKLPSGLNFPDSLKHKIYYDTENKLLIFTGVMSKDEKEELLNLSKEVSYRKAIEALFQRSLTKNGEKKVDQKGNYHIRTTEGFTFKGEFSVPIKKVIINIAAPNNPILIIDSKDTEHSVSFGGDSYSYEELKDLMTNKKLDLSFVVTAKEQTINNRGIVLVTKTGYRIGKDGFGKGNPRWITFPPYSIGKDNSYHLWALNLLGFFDEAYAYEYEQEKGDDSNKYRKKSKYLGLGKSYIADWQDSDWVAKSFQLESQKVNENIVIISNTVDTRKGRKQFEQIQFEVDGRLSEIKTKRPVVQVMKAILGTATRGREWAVFNKFVFPTVSIDEKRGWITKTRRVEYNISKDGDIEERIIRAEREGLAPDKIYEQTTVNINGEITDKYRSNLWGEWWQDLNNMSIYLMAIIGIVLLVRILGIIGRPVLRRLIKIPEIILHWIFDRLGLIKPKLELNPIVEGYNVWLLLVGRQYRISSEEQIEARFHRLYEMVDKLKDCPDFIYYLVWLTKDNFDEGLVRREVKLWYDIIVANQILAKNFKIGAEHRLIYDDINNLFRTKEFINRYEIYKNQGFYERYIEILNSVTNKEEAKELLEFLHYNADDNLESRTARVNLGLPEKSIIWKTYRLLEGGKFGYRGWLGVIRNNFPTFIAIFGGLYISFIAYVIGSYTLSIVWVSGGVALVAGFKIFHSSLRNKTEVKYAPPRLDEGNKPLRDWKWWKEWIFSFTVLGLTYSLKVIWNYFIFKWVKTSTLILLGSTYAVPLVYIILGGVGVLSYLVYKIARKQITLNWKSALVGIFALPAVGIGVYFKANLLLVGALWVPFLAFYILDVFVFFYIIEGIIGFLYGEMIGLGKFKSWSRFKNAFEQNAEEFGERFKEKFIPDSLGFTDREKETIWRIFWNAIIEKMGEEDRLSDNEKERYSYSEDSEPDFRKAPEDEDIEDRIRFFMTSLFMDTPRLPDTWDKIISHVVVTPTNDEDVLYAREALNEEAKAKGIDIGTKVTFLCYLISRYPKHWQNFIKRMQRTRRFTQEINELQKIYSEVLRGNLNYQLQLANNDLWLEVRFWGII